jgi:cytochrome b561
MKAAARPDAYSTLQILIHWLVAALVAFQYLFNEGIMASWHFYAHGEPATPAQLSGANIHISVGLAVLLLAIIRLGVRLSRGAPAAPEGEPKPLRILAAATHHLLYLLIFLVPLSGAAAWFFVAERAATGHDLMKALLFIVVLLHIAGAVVQAVVFRSNVFARMLPSRR